MSHPLFRKKTISAILADAQTGLSDATHSASGLNKVLRTKDLVAMGIAAIVGAGIFSTIGNASIFTHYLYNSLCSSLHQIF